MFGNNLRVVPLEHLYLTTLFITFYTSYMSIITNVYKDVHLGFIIKCTQNWSIWTNLTNCRCEHCILHQDLSKMVNFIKRKTSKKSLLDIMTSDKNELINNFKENFSKKDKSIAIVGLGYVGLPLALTFAEKNFSVIGIDIDQEK